MEKQAQEFLDKHLDGSSSLQALYQNIQKDMDKVEATLKIFTDSPNKIISEISSYLFQRSGKRIRPALVMLCSKLFGYQGDEHILLSSLVETIHTASYRRASMKVVFPADVGPAMTSSSSSRRFVTTTWWVWGSDESSSSHAPQTGS